MSISPTAGIDAAWSAAKVTPSDRAAPPDRKEAEPRDPPEAPPERKGPPPREGQGTRVDVRV